MTSCLKAVASSSSPRISGSSRCVSSAAITRMSSRVLFPFPAQAIRPSLDANVSCNAYFRMCRACCAH